MAKNGKNVLQKGKIKQKVNLCQVMLQVGKVNTPYHVLKSSQEGWDWSWILKILQHRHQATEGYLLSDNVRQTSARHLQYSVQKHWAVKVMHYDKTDLKKCSYPKSSAFTSWNIFVELVQ